MAHRYTDLPRNRSGHRGERALAELLDSWPDDRLHLWFALDYVPGVADIEALLLHEDSGVFVVEAKCVLLEDVRDYSLRECVIGDRATRRTPLQQALDGRNALADYLQRQSLSPRPFLIATACWPEITRIAWTERFSHAPLLDQAEGMIFAEDLNSPNALAERLATIARKPAVGSPARHWRYQPSLPESLEALLAGRPAQIAATTRPVMPSEVWTGPELERAKADYPLNGQLRVDIRGLPGTGKTHRLVEIGLAHAAAGGDALFVCFNKTLASDVRRRIAPHAPNDNEAPRLDVYDIFELIKDRSTGPGHDQESEDYDDWAIAVVEQLTRTRPAMGGLYVTVVIDEAQDLPEWAMGLVEALSRNDANLIVASGAGQSLYRAEPPAWLETFRASADIKQLRRNFRNRPIGFLAAQAFYELAPSIDHLRDWKRLPSTDGEDATQLGLDFDLPNEPGQAPRLLRVDTPQTERYSADDFMHQLVREEEWTTAVSDRIREELTLLGPDGLSSHLLVLVPSEKGYIADSARKALRGLAATGLTRHLDLVDKSNRRLVPQADEVRLCTFHSSRGLEARRVLVLGFEQIAALPSSVPSPWDLRNLGYIVLSRASEQTTILIPAAAQNEVTMFMDAVLSKIVSRVTPPGLNPRAESPTRVNSAEFGLGRVIDEGPVTVRVDFGSAGIKEVPRRLLDFL